jgi:hypothetical protein
MAKTLSIEHFREKSFQDPNSGCWLWQGFVSRKSYTHRGGYGQITKDNKVFLAHRLVYQIVHKIADADMSSDIFVCHKCDTPSCVNPDHLFMGTAQDNMNDCLKKGRIARGQRNAKSKLTEADVILIRQDSRSNSELGKIFGVNEKTIRQARVGETWTHIPPGPKASEEDAARAKHLGYMRRKKKHEASKARRRKEKSQ